MRLKALARSSFLLTLFLPSFFCRAEEPKGAALAPREVFVGDEAVFSYMEENLPLLELFGPLERGSAVELAGELLPADSSELTIKKVRLIPLQDREDAAICEITFVPWKTGEVSIPEIAFSAGESRRSRAVKVVVSSLAARYGATALMPNRAPLLPPGTLYLFYTLVLCATAACFFAAFAVRKLLERGRGPRRIPVKKIRREFRKLIKAQRRRIGENQPIWYAEFSAAVRLFFYRMTGDRKYLAADARDIARLLEAAQNAGTDEEAAAAKRLVAALFQIEQIRFSGEGDEEGSSEHERKSSNIDAFDGFAMLACAAPEAFFRSAEEGDEALPKNTAASRRKKDKRRAVV